MSHTTRKRRTLPVGAGVLLALLTTAVAVFMPVGGANAVQTPPPSACRIGALTPKFYPKTRQAAMGYHSIRCGGLGGQGVGYVYLVGEDEGAGNDQIMQPGKTPFWPAFSPGKHYIAALSCNEDKDGRDEIYTRVEWEVNGKLRTLRSKTINVNCSSKLNIKPYPG